MQLWTLGTFQGVHSRAMSTPFYEPFLSKFIEYASLKLREREVDVDSGRQQG